LEGASDFVRRRQRLNAVILCESWSDPAWSRQLLWTNAQAKFPLPAQILTLLSKLVLASGVVPHT
jgi:hypothetical protein